MADESKNQNAVAAFLPIGIVVTMLAGAIGITMSVAGLGEKITSQRGDIGLLSKSLEHMGDMLGIKLDAMGARVDRIEDTETDHASLYISREGLKSLMVELQVLNEGFKVPDDL